MLLKNCVPVFITEEIEDLEIIYKIQQEEIEKLNIEIKEALSQFFVNKATWGIKDWETFVGVIADSSKALEERQARVIAKLRGQGTSTVEAMEKIAESFIPDGKVDVIEHNSEYYFEIHLESDTGFPHELKGLDESIDEVKPAHLGVKYELISQIIEKMLYSTSMISGENVTVYPYTPKELESTGHFNVAAGQNVGVESVTLYPTFIPITDENKEPITTETGVILTM